ncbi:MAG: lysophospholipid acyltransferase family protein [Deltaproteobacteria bacterium]|nr:lysophospholipid acyltransferase family protein [Deltaproteobacteria bacterium]
MFKKLRKIAKTRPAGVIIHWIIRLYCATFRLKVENEAEWLNYLEQGGRVLLCGWHQQFFAGVRYFKKYKKYQPSLMSSKSLDGQIAAGVAKQVGFYTVWGSSSKRATAALKEMIQRLKDYRFALHLLDGPRGPAGVVKPGVIAIAHGAGAVIIPGVVIADRAWYLNSWDRFMIPKPFARVTIKYFPKIELPPEMDKAEYENQRKKLEEIMRPYLRL